MRVLFFIFFIILYLQVNSQPQDLTILKITIEKLNKEHAVQPQTDLLLKNLREEVKRVFNIELGEELNSVTTLLETLSLHLPNIDSTLKAHKIDFTADEYLSDLITSYLSALGESKVIPSKITNREFKLPPFSFQRAKNGELTITQIERNSCTENPLVHIGDKIFAVNDIPASFLTNGLLYTQIHFQDTIIASIRTHDNILKEVQLKTFKLEKAPNEYSYELKPGGIGLITFKHSILNSNTVKQIKSDLKKDRKNLNKIIIDIRYCSEGNIAEIMNFLNLFLEKGLPLCEVKLPISRFNRTFLSLTKPGFGETKLYVLTNSYTGSGANIISSVLQYYNRAKIIGEITSPVGSVFINQKIVGNTEVIIGYPIGSYHLPQQQESIMSTIPDIIIPDCINNQKDPILEYALNN